MPRADLHTHTVYSDGAFTPTRVVREALAIDLCAVAITDHDAIGGIAPAVKAAKGKNIEVVPGVELSSYHDGRSIHVIGLYIDVKNARLREHLDFFSDQRKLRAEKMVKRLNDLGVNITMEKVLKIAKKGALGRPHVALALVKLGAVRTMEEAFRLYLGHNRPAYVAKYPVSPSQAAEIIHESGGVAILAHPAISVGKNRDIRDIVAMGMDGIEIAHPLHDRGQEMRLSELADKERWLKSGGSDCHGEDRTLVSVGACSVDSKNLEEIRNLGNRYGENSVSQLIAAGTVDRPK